MGLNLRGKFLVYLLYVGFLFYMGVLETKSCELASADEDEVSEEGTDIDLDREVEEEDEIAEVIREEIGEY